MLNSQFNNDENSHSISNHTLNYYENEWVEKQLEIKSSSKIKTPTIVFGLKDKPITISELEAKEIITIYKGSHYKYLGNNNYEINPQNYDELLKLFEELKEKNLVPKQLVYLWTMEEVGTKEDNFLELSRGEVSLLNVAKSSLEVGIYYIFNILKCIIQLKFKKLSKMLVFYKSKEELLSPFYEILGSYGHSLGYILPELKFSTIQVIDESYNEKLLVSELNNEASEKEILYKNNIRYIKKLKTAVLNKSNKVAFKNKGTYLITGGAGALGLVFAEYLAKNYEANLILLGRSELSDKKQEIINNFNNMGSSTVYFKADVTDIEKMKEVINKSKKKFGTIDGIIHAAGLMSDKLINEKNLNQFEEIVQSKIKGTIILDELTKKEPLDFLILFSSTASIIGDFGQCDYSIGNRFLDSYGNLRNKLQKKDCRKGRTLVINWPLWQEGGMHQNIDTELLYLKSSGLGYLENSHGIESFLNIVNSTNEQVMVLYGDKERIESAIGISEVKSNKASEKKFEKVRDTSTYKLKKGESIEHALEIDLKNIASKILKIGAEQLDSNVNIGEFGFDSISLKVFAEKISERFNVEISPAIFFSVNTINSLAKHMISENQDEINKYYNFEVETEKEVIKEVSTKQSSYIEPLKNRLPGLSRFGRDSFNYEKSKTDYEPIAIVGINGTFPGSKDLDEFWENLKESKDLITEIPPSRWDWRKYYSTDVMAKNKSVSNSGGFIDDVDKFDAQFFNISPREAELMDPQHRLLLQTIWKTTEDAGYKTSDLSGKNIGVFIGFQFSDYQELLQDLGEVKPQIATGNAHAVLSNRISYFMNFRGPSESIDTACSGSLVAIHRAIGSIQSGESEMAFAGGVSLMLSPKTFLSASKLGILSPDNRCKTFDKDANGYVRGEGIGAILLKPLSKAIKDHDNIYAVIKGSAENHGGRANSLTAPNSDAQAAVLVRAYEKAEVLPNTITYIEAHGTGTELGDPVEIEGLKKAFKELYTKNKMPIPKENYCGIGSVKTNIGHLEPAAGIAGILKVVLALKNKKLPASINLKELNPYIEFNNSPFYIVKKTRDWDSLIDNKGNTIPRRAGVSSFGFGGANAHIVLEEYKDEERESTEEELQVIILSGKNDERLKEYAEDLLECLDKKDYTFGDIAFTLQLGRESMEERLAILARDAYELKKYLKQYISGEIENDGNIFINNIKNDKNTFEIFDDEDVKEMINQWINKKKLSKIAKLWVSGYEVNWNLLHKDSNNHRISLPTYPFKKERFWIPDFQNDFAINDGNKSGTLLDSIEYDLSFDSGIVFYKEINNQYTIAKDHIVKEQNIFPGVGYLEMAYQAARQIIGNLNFEISRVFWMNPLILNEEEKKVLIFLKKDKDKILFEIKSSLKEESTIIYAKGEIHNRDSNSQNSQLISLEEIKNRCTETLNGDDIYNEYERKGINYGPFFRGIKQVFKNNDEALGLLNLSENSGPGLNYYSLHPTLLDSALQIIGCIKESDEKVFLPFAVEKVEILKPLKEKMYTYVRASGVNSYNVALIDEEGNVCIKFHNFSLKEIKDKFDQLYYQLAWRKKPLISSKKASNGKALIIYGDNGEKIAERISINHKNSILLKLGLENIKHSDNLWEVKANDPNQLMQFISEISKVNTIYFLGGIQTKQVKLYDFDSLKENQEKGVISLFRLIKALEKNDLLKNNLKLKVITNNIYSTDNSETILPIAASINGFIKSLAKEYKKLNVTAIDIDLLSKKKIDSLIKPIFYEPYNPNGETIVYRNDERYERMIEHIKLPKVKESIFKENGVYIIIGGMGGIGLELSRYLSSKVKARLLLIGRSKLNDDKKAKIKEIEKLGGSLIYYKADVTDKESMKNAVEEAKKQFGTINGVFHSAIVSADKTIKNMNEKEFYAALDPKVIGTEVLCSVVQDEKLDFMAFFSSTSSVVGMPGQSNYVSGLNFQDAFANYIQDKVPYPVKTFNWGFWGIGSSEGDEYGKRLRQQGIYTIDLDEGMETIERVLKEPKDQVFILKANKSVFEQLQVNDNEEQLENMDIFKNTKVSHKVESSSVIKGTQEEQLKDYLKTFLLKILKVNKESVNDKTSFDEIGVDSLLGLELHSNLEKSFGELPPTLLFDNRNLGDLADYFLKNHQDKLSTILNENTEKTSSEDLFESDVLQEKEPMQLGLIKEKDLNIKFPVDIKNFLVEIDSKVKAEVCVMGEGNPILLIPGFAVTSVINSYQMKDWSNHYKVITVNLPGHGQSDVISDLTFSGISKMMMKVMDKLEIVEPFHVIGGSFGGMIAQSIAKEFSDRVKTLTLMGSFTVSKFEGVAQYFSFVEAVAKDFETVKKVTTSKEVIDNIDYCFNLYKASQATNSNLMLKYLELMKQGMTTRDILDQIKVPTLVMVGNVDSVVDPEESKIIHSKIENSKYIEIADGGHFINLTHHNVVNKTVINFLDEYESNSGK